MFAFRICWRSLFFFSIFFFLALGEGRTQNHTFPSLIVQFGKFRTATTTQFTILCAIARLKVHSINNNIILNYNNNKTTNITNNNNNNNNNTNNNNNQTILNQQSSNNKPRLLKVKCSLTTEARPKPKEGTILVQKTHICGTIQNVSKDGIPFFTTTGHQNCQFEKEPKIIQDSKQYFSSGFPYLVNQIRTEYKPLFSLTNHETAMIIEYMNYWSDIRRCCGLQMSRKYIRYLLLSGPEKKKTRLNHYCATKNTTQIERNLLNSEYGRRFGGARMIDSWNVLEDDDDNDVLLVPMIQSTCVISEVWMRLGLKFDGRNFVGIFGKSREHMFDWTKRILMNSSKSISSSSSSFSLSSSLRSPSSSSSSPSSSSSSPSSLPPSSSLRSPPSSFSPYLTDKEIYTTLITSYTKVYCEEKSELFIDKSPMKVRIVLCPNFSSSSSSSFFRPPLPSTRAGRTNNNNGRYYSNEPDSSFFSLVKQFVSKLFFTSSPTKKQKQGGRQTQRQQIISYRRRNVGHSLQRGRR